MQVIIIGAGPAGLAVGGALRRRGIPNLVLEKGPAVGMSWRGHYDRLHLHTVRALSGLPGFGIPRSMGRWVARADLVRYLEQYAAHHQLEVRPGVEVKRIEPDGEGWLLQSDQGTLRAPAVIVATGYNHSPVEPRWPGQESFAGELLHSSGYRNAAPYRGRCVLVAGSGNSGAEIAADLAEGGAAKVYLSVRTPPNIQRREALPGVPTQLVGILAHQLPLGAVDRISLALHRAAFGDLAAKGLPVPDQGVGTRIKQERIPLIDVGVVAAIRAGTVEVVPAVGGFVDGDVMLANGRRLKVDVVVAGTGFRRNLEALVGHLGLLGPTGSPRVKGAETGATAPNLYFLGYDNSTRGLIFEIARGANAIARRIARTHPELSGV